MTGTTAGRSGEAGTYRVLVAQGTMYVTGLQLANVTVVLPFIAAEFDLLWVAGLLYAAYSIGIVVGNSVSPYALQRAGHKKHFLIAGSTAIMAALILVAGISAQTGTLVGIVFLVASLTVGLVSAISKVAFSEVISSKLSEGRRRDLVLTQGALGAVAAILITLLLVPYLGQRDVQNSQLDLLWLGAAYFGVAAILAAFIGTVTTGVRHERIALGNAYREGLSRPIATLVSPLRGDHGVVRPGRLGASFYSVHASVNPPFSGKPSRAGDFVEHRAGAWRAVLAADQPATGGAGNVVVSAGLARQPP